MSRPPRPPARAHARSLRYGLVLAVLLAAPTLWSPLPADALGRAADPGPREESTPSASPDTVTWGVTPANETGPDGRRSVSVHADPGDQWQDHLAVRNVGAVDAVFRLSAADGYLTETGRFNTLPPGEDSVDAGTWITLPDSVHVPAGGTVVVPFTVSIPQLAEPGDHAAGISASLESVSAADVTGVGVESRVGFRVTIRVSGELAPTASLDVLGADYTTSWNPFAPGEMRVRLAVANTGNVRFTAQGTTVAGSGAAVFPTAGDDRHEFLPGDSREMDVVIPRVWPTFLVPVSVVLAPETVAIDGAAVPMASSVRETWAWAVPWPQGAVLVGLVLFTAALAGDRLRRRHRLDSLLAAAREDGRRDAHRGGAEQ